MTYEIGPQPPDECDVCHGMGYICEVCRAAVGECTCGDGPEEVPCPECGS